jgi:hypothetical protein
MTVICTTIDIDDHRDEINHFVAFKAIVKEMQELVGDFMIKITTTDPFPGSYGKLQLMQDRNTPIDATFDIFPSGYVYSRINGVIKMHESHRIFLKYLKSQ